MCETIAPDAYQTMQQWEEAGTLLASAVTNYLHLSLSLETNCLVGGVPPGYLSRRIDLSLDSLHVVLDRQIAEARSTLTRVRNQISSPVYRFPEEVLSEIFINTVFTPGFWEADVNEHKTVQFYRRIYNLIGVCSTWRNIVISRGVFWSIVPIIYSGRRYLATKHAANLSLERAQGRPLHFIAFLSSWPYDFPCWAEHASRLQTVSICTSTNAYEAMQGLLEGFLCSERLSLSQLSLCHTYEPSYYNQLPREEHYILNNSAPTHPLNNIIHNLSILRIKGAQFYWDHVTFSGRLTELHFQDVMIGYDTTLTNLLGALSSATQLRDLKFIGVRSFPVQGALVVPQIRLPSLESLLARDLSYNTLAVLLAVIASRSHRLTLFLTRKCRCIKLPGSDQAQDVDIQVLYQLLGTLSVHSLFLSGENEHGWLSAADLRNLVLLMPDLETLWINKWDLNQDACLALVRSPHPHPVLPNLKGLRFTQTGVWSEPAFKMMIISHSRSIQWLEFGIVLVDEVDGDIRFSYILGGWDNWLQENVGNPGIIELDDEYEPYEFEEVEWRMWS
ncbi:unnamed protein product [Rhizoctonia solani]|uniref:F-box domain-containing protein n=1 Tax=Rhizoctonia solani TaxID=456999 RepID=A0A8H3H9I6_9AGAM|nr:unnamed protein product [Rhizoctonia solani]